MSAAPVRRPKTKLQAPCQLKMMLAASRSNVAANTPRTSQITAAFCSAATVSKTPTKSGSTLPPHCFRSEEHTSELQSLMRISYAVFCLQKKNKHEHANTQIPSEMNQYTTNPNIT